MNSRSRGRTGVGGPMWWWPAVEARELAFDEVAELGAPDGHVPLIDCDCVLLTWVREGEELTYRVLRPDLLGVRRELGEGGAHELSLVMSGSREVLLERAPCAIVNQMADAYELVLRLPQSGGGVDAVCTDVTGPAARYRTGNLVELATPDFGPMATIHALRRGADYPSVQGDLSTARPTLGWCFQVAGERVVGEVSVQGRLERDGSMSHLRVEVPSAWESVDRCVVGNLGRARYTSDGGRAKVTVSVAHEGP